MAEKLKLIKSELNLNPEMPMLTAIKTANEAIGLQAQGPIPAQARAMCHAPCALCPSPCHCTRAMHHASHHTARHLKTPAPTRRLSRRLLTPPYRWIG